MSIPTTTRYSTKLSVLLIEPDPYHRQQLLLELLRMGVDVTLRDDVTTTLENPSEISGYDCIVAECILPHQKCRKLLEAIHAFGQTPTFLHTLASSQLLEKASNRETQHPILALTRQYSFATVHSKNDTWVQLYEFLTKIRRSKCVA